MSRLLSWMERKTRPDVPQLLDPEVVVPRSGMKSLDNRVMQFAPAIQTMLRLYGMRGTHAAIYRTQPEVRTVVNFVANQVAGIKLKLYEKVPSAKDLPDGRLELADHDMCLLLRRPGMDWSNFDLWFATVSDISIYDIAYWGKVRANGGRVGGIVRIPPSALVPNRDPQTQAIINYRSGSSGRTFEKEDLVIFRGYDPELNSDQVAPLETLRRILAEEYAAGLHRENTWKNAARKEGVIERPAEAPQWDDDQREAFLTDWEAAMTGPANSGRVGLLEDGMTWKDVQFDTRQLEYLAARKLTRVEVAAEYGVPPSLVGATERSATDGERSGYYQDRLGPFLTRLEQTIDLQLLPEFESFDKYQRQYTEFNLDEKMRGSFESEAKIMSTAVGGPWLTVNEARARRNLPPKKGGDELIMPLNSVAGGGPQASPQSPLETPAEGLEPAGTTPSPKPPADKERIAANAEWAGKFEQVFTRHFGRQSRTLAATKGQVWDGVRWDREMAHDLIEVVLDISDAYGLASYGILNNDVSDIASEVNIETMALYEKDMDAAFGLGRAAEAADRLAILVLDALYCKVAPEPEVTVPPEPVTPPAPTVTINFEKDAFHLEPAAAPAAGATTILVPPAKAAPVFVQPASPADVHVDGPQITIPEQRPADVKVDVAPAQQQIDVHVPAQPPSLTKVDVHVPEQPAPETHVEVNVPEQKPADVQVDVHVPEQKAGDVTVNVPEQPAPQVDVHVPEQKAAEVTVNVPEQPAAEITVNVPESKVEVPVTVNVDLGEEDEDGEAEA